KHLPDSLIIERFSVAFNPASESWLDIHAFNQAAGDGDVEDALCLYQGDFLQGLHLRGCREFEQWVITEQEILRQKMITTLQRKVTSCIDSGRYLQGLTYVRRLLDINPLLESAQRQLMRLLTYENQRETALTQYEVCREILENELGVEPSVETRVLYQQIQDGGIEVPTLPPSPPHNLLPQMTPFFGRKHEMWVLGKLIRDSNVRVISVIGPGGIGKTRLVQETSLTEVINFSDGVFFIPLVGLKNSKNIVPAVAKALSISFHGEGDSEGQLLAYLSKKNILLILDNIEHLLDDIAIIKHILDAAPDLKILITSRIKPDLPGEHIIQLGGMALPPLDTTQNIAVYSSAALFLTAAQRMDPNFKIGAGNQAAVVQICHLVEGMPLALLLAATWIQILDPVEIAAEIKGGVDFLETDAGDLTERHSSMRGVLNHSWRMLSEDEQAILSGLAVFRGGFTAEAAREVVGASLQHLRLLNKKTFIQRVDGKRYQIHEFNRQYLCEKLKASPEIETETRSRHSRYFIQELRQWDIDYKGSQQASAFERIRADIDNVRIGWDWAVEQPHVDQISLGFDGMYLYYRWLSLYKDGVEMCQDTLDRITSLKSGTARRMTARILTWQSRFCYFLREEERAVQLVLQSYTLLNEFALHDQDILEEKALTLTWMGALGRGMTEIEKIGSQRDLLEESILIWRQLNKTHELAWTLHELGDCFKYGSKYDLSKLAYEESLTIYSKNGNNVGKADVLSVFGTLNLRMGNLEEAERMLLESVSLGRSLGHQFLLAWTLQWLGWAYSWTGKTREAMLALEESLAILNNLGVEHRAAYSLARLALCQVILGNYEKAREVIEHIDYDIEERYFYVYGNSMMTRGMYLFVEGEYESAEKCIEKCIFFCEEFNFPLIRAQLLGLLGIMQVGSGKIEQAGKNIHEALRTGHQFGAYHIIVQAIPAAAYLIGAQEEAALAIEIYEAAKQRAFVKNSQWFEDTIGCKINALADDLPTEVVKG
ncbi:MAG: BTAD domain-containing putative transcriptional regulator, partial [Chloroflexota bacterium]